MRGLTVEKIMKTESFIRLLLLALLTVFSSSQDNEDEKRPYEFGFSIDGEQHRYEKKDEKGIIMGEFGFITADGIYHVTVYATDENGNFKILKMKNIKVGFPPGKPTTTTTVKPILQQKKKLNGVTGCGGCLIPENLSPGSKGLTIGTPDRSENERDNYPKLDIRLNTPSVIGYSLESNNFGKENHITKGKTSVGDGNEYLDNKGGQYPVSYSDGVQSKNDQNSIPVYDSRQSPLISTFRLEGNEPGNKKTEGSDVGVSKLKENYPSIGRINPQQKTEKSFNQLSDVEMKILDYMAQLYKFNYTLSFHGHEETGDLAGNKNGSYFSNGRDGYQRRVVYIANQFGYQPKISLVKLDAGSTPVQETEKELTELKGNEFIWFNKKE